MIHKQYPTNWTECTVCGKSLLDGSNRYCIHCSQCLCDRHSVHVDAQICCWQCASKLARRVKADAMRIQAIVDSS